MRSITLEAGFTTVRNVGADPATPMWPARRHQRGPHSGAAHAGERAAAQHYRRPLRRQPAARKYHATAKAWPTASPPCSTRCAEHQVRRDLIKICATGGVLSKGDDPQASQYTLEEMKAIVADAHRLGRKVAAHAHGAQGFSGPPKRASTPSSTAATSTMKRFAAMKKRGTYLVPTLYLKTGCWRTGNLPRSTRRR
jgi:imidazolonepropionase-like amidohydrolase